MENWEDIHRSRQQEYEARIRKQREDYWQESIRDAQEHFKRHITDQIEQGLTEYSTALRSIAAQVRQAGAEEHEIMAEETVMMSGLVRVLTRHLQEKYFPDRPEGSKTPPFVPPQDAPMIAHQDDRESEPPSPVSISQWSILGRNTDLEEEPTRRTQQTSAPGETGEKSGADPNSTHSPGRTVTPQRQVDDWINRRKNKRPVESIETGLPSLSDKRIDKRPRRDNSSWFAETIAEEPTELGSIHCREVEGQDFIFSNLAFPGFFFVIRCDRDSSRSEIIHRFQRHPLEYNRASNHFNKEKPKKKCHGADVRGQYTDNQLIVKFGYRVYGDDLADEDWVARSNAKTMQTATKGTTPATSDRARQRAQPSGNKKGKVVSRAIRNKTPTPVSSPSATLITAGPSATTTPTVPQVPRFGPPQGARPSLDIDTDAVRARLAASNSTALSASRSSTSRYANVAPVADMGTADLSLATTRRRNPSRPASRTSRLSELAREEVPDGLPAVPLDGGDQEWGSEFAEASRIGSDLLDSLT